MSFFTLTNRPKINSYEDQEVTWGEIKHDGHRLTVIKNKDNSITAWGKKAINIFPCLSIELQRHLISALPPQTVIDGELVSSSDEASDVTHQLAAAPEKLKYVAFAMPWIGGTRYFNSRQYLELRGKIAEFGFKVPDMVYPKDCTIDNARSLGIEGFVLKNRHYKEWYKLKVTHTVDVVVISAKPGEGKFRNQWGSLMCGVYKDGKLKIVANVGKGKDDQWRRKNLGELVGRVCEISHEGVQALGMLKFSSFVRWRDDKEEKECDYSQLIGL